MAKITRLGAWGTGTRRTGSFAGKATGVFSLDCQAAAYSVSGKNAGLIAAREFTADVGTYAYAGKSADLLKNFSFDAATGLYQVSGKSASFGVNRIFNAASGSYQVSGEPATLTVVSTSASSSGAKRLRRIEIQQAALDYFDKLKKKKEKILPPEEVDAPVILLEKPVVKEPEFKKKPPRIALVAPKVSKDDFDQLPKTLGILSKELHDWYAENEALALKSAKAAQERTRVKAQAAKVEAVAKAQEEAAIEDEEELILLLLAA